MKKTSTKLNFILQITYEILILGIPLFLSPYLTRTLGSESLGTYSYCYSIATYFQIFIMLGIKTHGCRVIAGCQDEDDKRKAFYTLFLLHIIVSVFVILIYILFILFAGKEYNFIYALLLFYLLSCLLDCTWFYSGEENFKSVIIKNTIVKIVEVVAIVCFVNKETDLWIYTLIMSASICLGQLTLVPPLIKRFKFYRPAWIDYKKYIIPLLTLTISIVAVNIYTVLDKTFIGAFIDDNKASVAFYDYSERIVKLPVAILATVGTVLLPKMTNLMKAGDKKAAEKVLLKSCVLLSCLASAACFGIAAISKDFAPIYYGDNFSICGEYMLYLSPLIIIIPFGATVRNSYLIPSGRDKQYLISLISAALINLVINIILIPILGVPGAIIGTISSELLACGLQFFFVRKELPIFRYVLELLPFILFGFGMYFEIQLLNTFIESPILRIILDIVIGGGSYLIVSFIYLFFVHREYIKEVFKFIFTKFKKEKKV